MPKPIMNLADAVFDDVEENGIYTSKRATIGDHIGARKLGYNLTVLPPGKVIEDEFFGRVATYRGPVVIRLPLAAGQPGGSVSLEVDSQGCADAGVCYPPQQQRLTLPLPPAGAGPSAPVDASPPKKTYFN